MTQNVYQIIIFKAIKFASSRSVLCSLLAISVFWTKNVSLYVSTWGQSWASGMGNAILRNHLKSWARFLQTLQHFLNECDKFWFCNSISHAISQFDIAESSTKCNICDLLSYFLQISVMLIWILKTFFACSVMLDRISKASSYVMACVTIKWYFLWKISFDFLFQIKL